MVEMSQSTATTPLDPQAQLTAALGAAAQGVGQGDLSPASGLNMAPGPDMAADAGMAAAASLFLGPIAGPIIAGAIALADAIGRDTNNSDNKNKNTLNSQFVSWRAEPVQRQTRQPTPIMPRVAGRSVFAPGTADKTGGAKREPSSEDLMLQRQRMKFVPSGVTVTKGTAAQLGLPSHILKEIDTATVNVTNPYGQTGQASTQRLKQDLKNGSPTAQKAAQTFPKHGMTAT